MNPNPFASLNHFTVPVTIYPLLSMLWGGTLPPCPHDERSRECNTYRPKTHPEPSPARPGSGRAAADIGGFRKQNSRSPASFLPSTTYLSWCQRMAFDLSERASGVLLHPTSLPGPHGSGDLGPESHALARWLRDAGQRWWQMPPVGPIGHGNSPYRALRRRSTAPAERCARKSRSSASSSSFSTSSGNRCARNAASSESG